MSRLDIYDIKNYFPYNEDLGIMDYACPDITLVNKLKELPFQKKVVVNRELLDSISHKVYGTEKLWWVLSLYNNIIDPFITEELELSIPSLSDIEFILIDLIESKRMNI